MLTASKSQFLYTIVLEKAGATCPRLSWIVSLDLANHPVRNTMYVIFRTTTEKSVWGTHPQFGPGLRFSTQHKTQVFITWGCASTNLEFKVFVPTEVFGFLNGHMKTWVFSQQFKLWVDQPSTSKKALGSITLGFMQNHCLLNSGPFVGCVWDNTNTTIVFLSSRVSSWDKYALKFISADMWSQLGMGQPWQQVPCEFMPVPWVWVPWKERGTLCVCFSGVSDTHMSICLLHWMRLSLLQQVIWDP